MISIMNVDGGLSSANVRFWAFGMSKRNSYPTVANRTINCNASRYFVCAYICTAFEVRTSNCQVIEKLTSIGAPADVIGS